MITLISLFILWLLCNYTHWCFIPTIVSASSLISTVVHGNRAFNAVNIFWYNLETLRIRLKFISNFFTTSSFSLIQRSWSWIALALCSRVKTLADQVSHCSVKLWISKLACRWHLIIYKIEVFRFFNYFLLCRLALRS